MNLTKIIQIVHHLLAKNGYRLNYTKLIKLLYLADREALSLWDSSISKDSYASLAQGPVLSGLYNLVKGTAADRFAQTEWNGHFMKDDYDLIALHKGKLPIDELSEREIEVLDRIEKQYRGWKFGKLIELLHDQSRFPEWTDPGSSSLPLAVESILRSLGRNEEEIKTIAEEEKSFQEEEEYLKKCCV
ncbi:MAG: SocA family protein [Planctomycetes bacterium]|jgi:uncharacterized phage-associated protein|nr:SocA family protein [Planctomycetota bacterium]